MNLKDRLKEAKKTTKIAAIGGAIVIAGSWGSCQLNLGAEDTEEVQSAEAAEETPAENTAEEPSSTEPEKEEAPAAE